MDNIKVSIITVCYNSVNTIEKTIQSVINQSYNNIEYIIIDGGSTDGTIDIVCKYAGKIAYWVSEPDNGIYDAMNKGVHSASGDIIGFINSDDWYALNAVEEVVNCFCKTKSDVIYGDFTFVEKNEMELKRLCNINQDDLYYKIIYCHQSVFVKTSLQKRSLFDCNYKIAADYKSLLNLYIQGYSFTYINANIAYFRRGGMSDRRLWRCTHEVKNISLETIAINGQIESKYKDIINNFYSSNMEKLRTDFLYNRALKRGYFYRYLKTILDSKEEYVIFGSGMIGKQCYEVLNSIGVRISYFVDSSVIKQGQKLYNLSIKDPKYLLKDKGKIKILITSIDYGAEIKKQLIDMGFIEQFDYQDYEEIRKNVICRYKKEKLVCENNGRSNK